MGEKGGKGRKDAGAADELGPISLHDLTGQQEQLAVRASWLYYMEGQTQEQIARTLGINRIRINRILAAARESGLVQVRINSRLASRADRF